MPQIPTSLRIENLPTLTDDEKQAMSNDKPLHVKVRVKSNYLNLNKHRLSFMRHLLLS
ncbi:MAG: hypothetical protein V7K40_20980 [Nostoc sp.]